MFIEAQVFILTGLCGSVRQQLRSASLGDFMFAPLIKGLDNLSRLLLLRPVRKTGLAA